MLQGYVFLHFKEGINYDSIYGNKHFSKLHEGDYMTVNHGFLKGVKGQVTETSKNKI